MDELKPILNLACAQAKLGYGGVLHIDLGDLVEHYHPKLKRKFHGIWQVRSHSGTWRIYNNLGLVAGDYDDEPVLEAAIGQLANHRLLAVELSDCSSDTRLRFSDSLFVDFLEASSTEVNWETIGPGVQISFGPGPNPTFSRPDEVRPGLTLEEIQLNAHADKCAKRWKPVVPPEAADKQSCSRCAYYMPLRGLWYFWDYGLCTNPASPFDGKVTNVGTGCAKYAAELEDDMATNNGVKSPMS